MTMKIKIDEGVPVPPKAANRSGPHFPWREMVPGASFFAAGYVQNPRGAKHGEPTVTVGYGKKIHPGSKWATRTVTENGVTGVRVWRLA